MIPYKQAYKMLEKYLSRHPLQHGELGSSMNTAVVVVIPAYKEEDYLAATLNSLKNCEQPKGNIRLVIVLNSSIDDENQEVEIRQKELAQKAAADTPSWLSVDILEAWRLPKKHFGAGLARRIGMDAAADLFYRENNPDGIIVALDADTTVERTYFKAIEEWFSVPGRSGANIFFEHPKEGEEYPAAIYEAIIKYELHLRYMKLAHSYAGFLYPFHSMGSAMAMRAVSYARAGGVPRKQAGEDFYFLQKLIPLGGFGELNNCTVFPSPRLSDRVIFGTGAAITAHIGGSDLAGLTYNIQAFEDLKQFFEVKGELFEVAADAYESWTYKLSGSMRSFLLNSGFFDELEVIKRDCATRAGFDKRFFELFNAFKVVKYLNYSHGYFYERTPVFDMAIELSDRLGITDEDLLSEKELLLSYRKYERENPLFVN